ncbi:MAG: group 1 truncated hemoglobin [Usitatibacter sp.]
MIQPQQARARRFAACVATVLACGACAAPSPCAVPTLYHRMGGEPVVRRVVDDVIDRTAADPRTGRSFKDVKMARLKEKLREQICNVAGGGCAYTGDPMLEVHKGLKVTEAEFSLMVQFLREALERFGVHEAEKNELLRLLGPMKRDIVKG